MSSPHAARPARHPRGRLAAVTAAGALALTALAAPATASAEESTEGAVLAGAAEPAETTAQTYVAGLIVDRAPGAGLAAAARRATSLGVAATIDSHDATSGTVDFAAPVALAEAEQIRDEVEKLPGVRAAELNVVHLPTAAPPGGAPDEKYFSRLLNIWDSRSSFDGVSLPEGGFSAKVPYLWQLTKGKPKVVVAVLDTGQTSHPDLDPRTVPGYDMVSDTWTSRDGDERDPDPRDEGDWVLASDWCADGEDRASSWHGTHVAGTVAAALDGAGVVGAAPGVRVQHVRVLGRCGGTTEDIAAGITWASGGKVSGLPKNPTPAKVLNLSLAGAIPCQPVVQRAITNARKRGAVVVVAAGNNGADVSDFQPANCKGVVVVGATDHLGHRAFYSNTGGAVDVSAPGGDFSWGEKYMVYSTLNKGTTSPQGPTWGYMQGTSMATPLVSGVAALVASLRPDAGPAQIERVLTTSVQKFPTFPGIEEYSCAGTTACGSGVVDASKVPTAFLDKPVVTNARVTKKARVDVDVVSSRAKISYQWLRDGKKISGATSATYKVAKKDLGKKLSVKVTVRHSGFPSRTFTTAKVKVSKLKPSMALAPVASTLRSGKKAKITVTVKSTSLTKKPTGKLVVKAGGRSKTYALKASMKGVREVAVPTKLAKGRHTVKVTFTPSSTYKKYLASRTVSTKITVK